MRRCSNWRTSMKALIMCLPLFLMRTCFSQTAIDQHMKIEFKDDSTIEEVTHYIETYHEEYQGWIIPGFKGGQDSLEKFIYDNLHYPKEALAKKRTGEIIVFFRVDTAGKISRLSVDGDRNYGFETEAKRIVSAMPAWVPGTKNGIVADFSVKVTISFKINDGVPMTSYAEFLKDQKKIKAVYYYNEGINQFASKNYKRALAAYNGAIRLDQTKRDYFFNRAICRYQLYDDGGACKDINEFIRLGGIDSQGVREKVCK
jgi:TonB family protein